MPTSRIRTASPIAFAIVVGLAATVAGGAAIVAQARKDFAVAGRKYSYSVNGGGGEIRVQQGDLVSITFSAEDIPHTFTIEDDHYRIDRRAEPGKPVTFRFVADKPGEFTIRCNLSIDERCLREMRGVLKVEGK